MYPQLFEESSFTPGIALHVMAFIWRGRLTGDFLCRMVHCLPRLTIAAVTPGTIQTLY
jgi:hypothetical protein